MDIECRVILEYASAGKADIVYNSTRIDDTGFVEARVDGNRIIAYIKSKTVSSLIHTLDDYLACITVAESIADKD